MNPQVLKDSPEICKKRLNLCLEHFVLNGHLAGTAADKVKQEFSIISDLPTTKAALASFRRQDSRLDKFWMDVIKSASSPSPNFTVFVKKVLILSHGNATLERGFSINKECVVVNQHEASLVGQRLVYDAVLDAGGVKKIQITKGMIQYARNAYARYKEYQDRQKADKTEVEREAQRKREAARLTKELEAKKAHLLADAQKEAALIDERLANLLKK